MSGADRVRLRGWFNQAAELYDRARPGYLPALFDELAGVAGVGPGCRVLEIGCGTGQATVPLAERDCRIVAVELGAAMAAVARRNLARFPAVEVAVAAFQDWPLPPEPFDVVVAATAWHWLDPAVRVAKAAAALRPGGTLATVATHHVAGGDAVGSAQCGRAGWGVHLERRRGSLPRAQLRSVHLLSRRRPSSRSCGWCRPRSWRWR